MSGWLLTDKPYTIFTILSLAIRKSKTHTNSINNSFDSIIRLANEKLVQNCFRHDSKPVHCSTKSTDPFVMLNTNVYLIGQIQKNWLLLLFMTDKRFPVELKSIFSNTIPRIHGIMIKGNGCFQSM